MRGALSSVTRWVQCVSTESLQVGAVRESSVCERGSVSHQVGAVRASSMCERGT